MPKFDPITRYQMHYVLCRLHGLEPLPPAAFSIMELGDLIEKTTKAMNKFATACKELSVALNEVKDVVSA